MKKYSLTGFLLLTMLIVVNGQNEVGNAAYGFKFTPPGGWIARDIGSGFLLGHNTIAGLILVFPGQAQTPEMMKQEMAEGIQEENTYMSLSGSVEPLDDNKFIAGYSGYFDGAQAKGKGIGVMSPGGGGVYILAVSTPAMLGEDIIAAAKEISNNIEFIKPDVSNLMAIFAGKWSTVTTNTSTDVYLYPNGVYSEHYEAAYSGNFTNGGETTGNWGAANSSDGNGRWTINGTREKGTLTIIYSTGERTMVNYQVHVENGETYYNEYWFDGTLYVKSPIEY